MTRNVSPNEAPKLVISKVAVAFEQTKVYANKRQQARFRLELECTHDGKEDYLTASEIDSLELLEYQDKDSTIPFSDDGSLSYKGWSAQKKYLGYLSQTDTGGPALQIDTPPPAGPRQHYFLYVTAGPDAVETLRFSFRLTGDDGSIYRTNGFITINGKEQFNSVFDLKDKITVGRVDPVTYLAADFELVRRSPGSGDKDGEERASIFDDIVTVSIRLGKKDDKKDGKKKGKKDDNDQPSARLGIRAFHCEPAGLIHWKDKVAWLRQPCFTGYVDVGQTDIHWNDAGMAGHWGGHPRPAKIDQAETDAGVIVLCGRVDIPAWSGAPESPLKVTMIDAHGTDQTCRIGFKDGERDELVPM